MYTKYYILRSFTVTFMLMYNVFYINELMKSSNMTNLSEICDPTVIQQLCSYVTITVTTLCPNTSTSLTGNSGWML